jgi:hypothetical protein
MAKLNIVINFNDSDNTSLEIGNNKINSLSSLSQSTPDASSITYGIYANSGSVEISDTNGEIQQLINDKNIDPTNIDISIYIKDNIFQNHISSDSSYDNIDKTLTISLTNSVQSLKNISIPSVFYKSEENLYNFTHTILSGLGYSDDEIKKSLSRQIVYGNEYITIQELFENITIPNIYLPDTNAEEVINKICQVGQVFLTIDDDGSISFDIARPSSAAQDLRNAIYITSDKVYEPLKYSLIKKDKYTGVTIPRNDTDYSTYPNVDETSNNIFIGTTNNAVTLDENELYQNGAKIFNEDLVTTIANNIIDDYKDGILVGTITICGADLYDINGNKVVDWANGERIKVGDIVCIAGDKTSSGTQRFWKVTGRSLDSSPSPQLFPLELMEVYKGQYSLLAGMYDTDYTLLKDWDELIDDGLITVSINGKTVTSSTKDVKDVLVVSTFVTTIGANSFQNRTDLSEIQLSTGVKTISNYAFSNCTQLSTIELPKNLETIGDYSFATNNASYQNSPLKVINYNVVDDSKLSVSSNAFEWFKYPNNITVNIGNKVQYIRDYFVFNINDDARKKIDKINFVSESQCATIGEYAFAKTIITKIDFPNSLKSIGASAFSQCKQLKEYNIPQYTLLENIGDSAFYECTGLTNIIIPKSLTALGDQVFFGCTNVNSISFNAESLADYTSAHDTFTNVGANTDGVVVAFGNSVKSVPAYLFYDSNNAESYAQAKIKNVSFGNNVKSIGKYAFYNCSSLGDVNIPNLVDTIGSYTFENCTGLKTITIGEAVTNLQDRAFSNCINVDTIKFNAISVDTAGSNIFNGVGSKTKGTKIVFGNKVTKIPENLFLPVTQTGFKPVNANITTATLSNSIVEIGGAAFDKCTKLKSIDIPDSVTTIGGAAFENCTSLAHARIGNSVTMLDALTFCLCTSLSTIFIPSSVTKIVAGNYVYAPFVSCSSSLKIYCEAASKPDGWGTYWNYYSENGQLEVHYGYTREQYEQETGDIS